MTSYPHGPYIIARHVTHKRIILFVSVYISLGGPPTLERSTFRYRSRHMALRNPIFCFLKCQPIYDRSVFKYKWEGFNGPPHNYQLKVVYLYFKLPRLLVRGASDLYSILPLFYVIATLLRIGGGRTKNIVQLRRYLYVLPVGRGNVL